MWRDAGVNAEQASSIDDGCWWHESIVGCNGGHTLGGGRVGHVAFTLLHWEAFVFAY